MPWTVCSLMFFFPCIFSITLFMFMYKYFAVKKSKNEKVFANTTISRRKKNVQTHLPTTSNITFGCWSNDDIFMKSRVLFPHPFIIPIMTSALSWKRGNRIHMVAVSCYLSDIKSFVANIITNISRPAHQKVAI